MDAPGVLYDERSNGNIFYLRHNYRDYVYTPDVPLGQDIVKIDYDYEQLVHMHKQFHILNLN